ncbi:retrovirus-related pol polyprotein from transposon TNT 1-94, partial [Tanacetum coccineum]
MVISGYEDQDRALLINMDVKQLGGFTAGIFQMEAEAKADLNKKAYSAVILCLGNKVLREVTEETTAAGVWTKLKTLYMTKSLANKLYLKKKLYTFNADWTKDFEHIDEFNKIVLICNIEVNSRTKSLLYYILTSYQIIWNTFWIPCFSGLGSLTLEMLVATLNSKEIKERSKAKGVMVKGYMIHLKRNCPKNNRKKSTGYVKKDDQPSSSGSTYDDSENAMGAVYSWVTTGSVKSESGKIKVINGSRVILSGIRRDNCVYSLDGHAMAGLQGAGKAKGVGQEKSILWGPSGWNHMGDKRYFLSIIDDYSRRVWVYILRFKHEAFGMFKEWNQLVENQTGRTVKKLRMDNSVMYKDTLKNSGAGDKSIEELQVDVELQRLNNHTPDEDQTHHEDGNDEDAGDQEIDQLPDLTDYQLVRDREPMTRTKPLRFRDESNMAAYAFVAAEEE